MTRAPRWPRVVGAALALSLVGGSFTTSVRAQVAGPARTIDCTPATATNASGTEHVVTCTVTDGTGNAVENAEVFWTTTGPGHLVAQDGLTDAKGEARAVASSTSDESGDQVISAELEPLKTDCDEPADSPTKGLPAGNCFSAVKKTWLAESEPLPPQTTCAELPEGSTHVLDDVAGVDDAALDLRRLCLGLDAEADATTVEVTLLAPGPSTAVLVWLDTTNDGAADVVISFEDPGTGPLAEAWTIADGSPLCQPLEGDTSLGRGPATVVSDKETTWSFTFHPMVVQGYFVWGGYATSSDPVGVDFIPELIDPAYPATSAPGGEVCADELGRLGIGARLGRSEPLDGAIPEELLAAGHGDSHGAAPLDVKEKLASFPKNRAPVGDVVAKPARPRAGATMTLNAGRSTDPEGKRLRGFTWDLDGDGRYGDAFGKKIDFAFATPGRNRVSVLVFDRRGRADVVKEVVDVRRGAALGTKGVVNDRPAGLAEETFEAGLGDYDARGTAFVVEPEPTLLISQVLGIDRTVGGTYADIPVPVGSDGSEWVTSFNLPPGVADGGLSPSFAGNLATGVLASPEFAIDAPYVSYLLGGDDDRDPGAKHTQRVELWVADDTGQLVKDATLTHSPEQEQLEPVVLDVTAHQGTSGVLVVIDGSSQGHINIDGIQVADTPLVPEPAPVLGLMDTHVHVMAHQAFGGLRGIRTYMGVPGGAWNRYAANPRMYDEDVARDSDNHFGGALGRILINVVEGRRRFQRERFLEDLFSAVGSIVGFEFHDTTSGPAHEQMHITEIRRAWEGGLRLMSSLAVSSSTMEYAMGTVRRFDGGAPEVDVFGAPTERDGPERSVNVVDVTPDKDVLEAHAVAIRQLAALNSDWMQVVYSPEEARDAIAAGKLAIVLGSEVDTLGNIGGLLNSPTGPQRLFASAQEEVDYLWNLGYRQIQLIHAIDNSIGGASVFQDPYNTANDLLHRPMFNATRRRVSDDFEERGPAISPKPGAPGPPNFGFFMRTNTNSACEAVRNAVIVRMKPRGDCVQWFFNKEQTMVAIDSFGPPTLVTVHPAAARKEIPNYRYDDDLGDPAEGQVNNTGLTPYGYEYVRALMRRGMLIDIEHASDKTLDALIDPGRNGAARGPLWDFLPEGGSPCHPNDTFASVAADCYDSAYPVLSSHTSFRGQSFAQRQECTEHIGFVDLNPPNLAGCGTTVKGFVAREFERTPAQVEYIRASGGTLAPVVGHDPVDSILDDTVAADRPDWRLIPGRDRALSSTPANDCAGSTKSWLQAYLYAVSKMGGQGVGLSTDMSMVGSTRPRFRRASHPTGDFENPGSCTSSLEADQPAREESVNPGQFNRDQSNPVAYASPFISPDDLVGSGLMRQQLRPNGVLGDFNFEGHRSYGLLPDLLQDATNVGLSPDDLLPAFQSAQDYIDMWSKTFFLAGCAARETSGECAGIGLTHLDEAAVCRNTCPLDEGRGMSLRPNGTPFRFKPPFDR